MRRQSYCLGAVSTINACLAEQKVRTPITPGALVPLKKSLIKQTLDEFGNIRTIHGRRSYVHAGAYQKGQSDGKRVSVNKGIETARSARKELTTTITR